MKAEDIKPGYYKVVRDHRSDVVQVYEDGRVTWLSYIPGDTVESILAEGWTFTRLVPAEEVEKAFYEGFMKGEQRDIVTPGSRLEFGISRAKRIAEGLE